LRTATHLFTRLDGVVSAGVEVGVQFGEFADTLLLTWATAQLLFVVDPWREFTEEEHYRDSANVDQVCMCAMIALCRAMFSGKLYEHLRIAA
jgi:hypothetical protein